MASPKKESEEININNLRPSINTEGIRGEEPLKWRFFEKCLEDNEKVVIFAPRNYLYYGTGRVYNYQECIEEGVEQDA